MTIKPPLIASYIYIWSILFEPLGYFILLRIGSINFSIARALQFFVIVLFLTFLFQGGRKTVYVDKLDRNYIKYFLLFSLFGILPLVYAEIVKPLLDFDVKREAFNESNLISPQARSAVIILSSLFKIVYFILFFRYFVNDDYLKSKFLVLFKRVFFTVMFLGFLDYLSILTGYGHIFTRHFHEDVTVGLRFHSILGEPRHVLPYLALVAAVALLMRSYRIKLFGLIWWTLIPVGVFLTGSFSSLVATFLAITATMIYGGKGRYVFLFAPLFLIFYIISDDYNAHISFYTNHFSELFTRISNLGSHDFGYMVVGKFGGQDRDIFPVLARLYGLGELSGALDLLIGTGLMSATIDYNYAIGNDIFALSPPSSWAVVLIYEYGVIGLILFIVSLYKPIWRYLPKGTGGLQAKELLIFVTVVCLVQKSDMLFIFLGILSSFYATKSFRKPY